MQTELISVQQSFILKSTVPNHILDPINQYLDQLLEDTQSISHADKLVGCIKEGKQLTISPQEKRVKLFINTIQEMSLSYYHQFPKGSMGPLILWEKLLTYKTSGQFTVMLAIIIRYTIICVIHCRDYPVFYIQKSLQPFRKTQLWTVA